MKKIFNQRQRRRKIYLPEEITEKILLKLPIKSLLRFKSVSKQWLSLISHPNFFQSHLKLSFLSVQDQKIMALSTYGSRFYLLNRDGNTVLQKYNYNLPWPASCFSEVHLLGSCNGLLCLGIFRKFNEESNNFVLYNPILWNPPLNDYKKVPFFASNVIYLFGFGYDSHTEDYKFVSVKPNEAEADVYSLKSGSIRRVPFELPLSSVSHMQIGTFFNGSLYWISFNRRSFEHEFIIFDLRCEKFKVLKFPTKYKVRNPGVDVTIVRVCDGLAVFFCDTQNDDYFNYKLVTMKEEEEENGSNLYWSMINDQHPKGNLCWPICYMMNGEILVRLNNKFPSPRDWLNDLFVYNLQQRTTKKVAIPGAKEWSEYTTYVQTLVLPSKLIAPSS